MNPTPLRKALTSMTRSLAEKGDYRSIFQALKSASPEVAAKYLNVCSSDEALAGAALALGNGDADGYSFIDHYLTGNAAVMLTCMQYVLPRLDLVKSQVRRTES